MLKRRRRGSPDILVVLTLAVVVGLAASVTYQLNVTPERPIATAGNAPYYVTATPERG